MDNVRVHYHSPKPAELNALAYTQGTEIHVAPGQEQHLSHEAWHVVQQAQGRVKPTMQMKEGVLANDDGEPSMIDDLDETLRKLLMRELPVKNGEVGTASEQSRREWSAWFGRPRLNRLPSFS